MTWQRTFLVPVESLTPQERAQLVRRARDEIRSGVLSPYVADWLASGLDRYMNGAGLEAALRLKPARGSRQSVAAVSRSVRVNHALAAFAGLVGGAAAASRVLKGESACPANALAALRELRGFPAVPVSVESIRRAIRIGCQRPDGHVIGFAMTE